MTHQLTMDGRKHNIVASIIHPGSTLSSFITRTGRTKAGPGEKPEDYVMAAEDIAKVALLMATLPPEVNLYEATILPNHARSFIGRGWESAARGARQLTASFNLRRDKSFKASGCHALRPL